MVSSVRGRLRLLRLALMLGAVGGACLTGPLTNAEALGVLHAAPDGTGSTCTVEAPCDLETAIQEAGDNWAVILAPGTYAQTQTLVLPRAVVIEGKAGPDGPKPLIEAPGTPGSAALESTATGMVVLRDLRIHSPAGTGKGIDLRSSEAFAERVESTGAAEVGCYLGSGTARDSLCEAKPGGGVGLEAIPLPASSTELKLANVTAIGGEYGLSAETVPSGNLTVHAVNTIASGGGDDIRGVALGLDSITVDLSHSSFDSVSASMYGVTVTPNTAAGNLAAPPVFVDAGAGNYREAFGSPTYRAGDLAAVVAEREARESLYDYDLDGLERTTTCDGTTFVDIGAYQLGCPEPEEPGHEEAGHEEPRATTPGPAAATTPPGPGPTTRPAAPRLARLALKPAKFRVAAAGKATRKAGGTRITFTLTADARVRFQVLGRKAAKGRKKPRTVVLGWLRSVHGKAGANEVRFSGRLRSGRALKAGRYRLRAVARGAGGGSAPVTKPFRIVSAS